MTAEKNKLLQVVQREVIVAITGATGAIYGVRLLEKLREIPTVKTHVVVSDAGWLTVAHELNVQPEAVKALADVWHEVQDVGASIASGSYRADSMVIAPCSMKTLSAIAHAYADNLIVRAADVMLKERRRLLLMVRETPLHQVHLRNMLSVTEMGGIIFPPVPGFYHAPETVMDIVDQTVGRVLDLLDLPLPDTQRWCGDTT